jgi:peptidoglycan hydrolase CwlO-like protein
MKVECTICTMQEILSEEAIKEVSKMVNKYKLPAISYIKILNMIRGKCLNGDEHSFQFDDEFMSQIGYSVEQHKKANSDIQNLTGENSKLEKELSEHEAKIKEIRAKVEANEDRMTTLEMDIEDCKTSIHTLTGADDIAIWY